MKSHPKLVLQANSYLERLNNLPACPLADALKAQLTTALTAYQTCRKQRAKLPPHLRATAQEQQWESHAQNVLGQHITAIVDYLNLVHQTQSRQSMRAHRAGKRPYYGTHQQLKHSFRKSPEEPDRS